MVNIIWLFFWNESLTLKGMAGLLLILIGSFFNLYREYNLSIKVNTDQPIR